MSFKAPVSIFQNDWGGCEPKIWGVILLDTMAYSRGRANIVTDSDFCWPFLGTTECPWPFSALIIRQDGSIARKLRPSQGTKAKNQILHRGRQPRGIKIGGGASTSLGEGAKSGLAGRGPIQKYINRHLWFKDQCRFYQRLFRERRKSRVNMSAWSAQEASAEMHINPRPGMWSRITRTERGGGHNLPSHLPTQLLWKLESPNFYGR